MVNEIEFTDFAKRKLKSIFKYYAENVSERVASKLVKNIVQSTNRLIKFPESGQLESFKLEPDTTIRSVKYKSYKLLYSFLDDKIVIFHVFDMRRNPKILEREMKDLGKLP